jgi:hypothetical protein
MRKVLLGLLIILIPTPAFADGCPSGVCAVEINCTTGEVTWRDVPLTPALPLPVIPEPVAPTHTINVQTASGSWGTSGTPDQIAQAVQSLAPQPLTPSPCLNGGCNKVEINVATKVVTVLPLSENDLKESAKHQVQQSQRQAELAKSAYQALPNITAWQPYDPFIDEPLLATIKDETLTPEWWASWTASLNSFYASMFWWWAL